MHRRRPALLALALAVLLAGCHARLEVRAAGPDGPAVEHTWGHVFLWGAIRGEVQTGLGSITSVETYRVWWHYLACLGTAGLWLPQSVIAHGWYPGQAGAPGGVNVTVSTPVNVTTTGTVNELPAQEGNAQR